MLAIIILIGTSSICWHEMERYFTNKKAEMIKTFKAEGIPNAIKLFEKLLSTNGGKFFVGKEVCFLHFIT